MSRYAPLTVGVCAALALVSPACKQEADSPGHESLPADTSAEDKTPPDWRLAMMAYTFRNFTLFEAIEKTNDLGLDYIEGFTWQKIGADDSDAKFDANAPDELIDALKAKLDDTGIQMVTFYSQMGNDEEQDAKVFALADKMGVEAIICEPPADALERLDKLAAEHRVKLAIHNHPKDPTHPDYINWDPAAVMKMLEGRSEWIGTCADTGHWARSGIGPVEGVKTYKDRLISLHLKDVEKPERKSRDVPWGTGIANIEATLAELDRQGFSGIFSIEYEHNPDDNTAEVAECIELFNKVEDELGH